MSKSSDDLFMEDMDRGNAILKVSVAHCLGAAVRTAKEDERARVLRMLGYSKRQIAMSDEDLLRTVKIRARG